MILSSFITTYLVNPYAWELDNKAGCTLHEATKIIKAIR